MNLIPAKKIAKAGLVYTSDEMPGYSRLKRGKGFSYHFADGRVLREPVEIQRIRSLAIPPAYQTVWICMDENGHLQATGIDARGRKQYRYHPRWHELAGQQKFERLPQFVRSLPRIRATVRKQLAEGSLGRERVIAAVITLLDLTGYRIGGKQYLEENGSYGLTTLRPKHVDIHGGMIDIHFKGKAGMPHETVINDETLSEVLRELHDLPGQHLFRYTDESGQLHDVGSADINDWLKSTTGNEFTAKQFRTCRATVLCAGTLGKLPPAESKTARTRVKNQAIRETAAQLHHRPATCRKYYIHPAVFRAYDSGELHRIMNSAPPSAPRGLYADERRVVTLLEKALNLKTPLTISA